MMAKLRLKLISALFILLFVQVSFAYAQQGGLHLIAVTLADGGNLQDAADVSVEPRFKVHFDRNVISDFLWENNSKCFSLISQDNATIPVNVTRGEDSDDSTQKQNIFVQPVNPLNPGTVYYLKISPELKAKNGSTLGGQEISIAFKTKPAAVTIQPVPPAKPGDAPSSAAPAPADSGTPAE